MTYRFGIDLGTTYTAGAVHRDGVTRLVQLGLRQPEIPSVVAVTDDGVLVGDEAEHHGRHAPSTLVRNAKRRFGDPTPIVVNGQPWSPERLAAEILQTVLERTVEMEGGPPESIVLTHPAAWGDYKLDALRQAAQLASIDCELVAEPVAAASHYVSLNRLPPQATLVVFDFGGGTFDTSIIAVDGASFASLGEPIGLDRLGGIDLDEAILAHVCEDIDIDPFDIGETPEGRKALARLRVECREAKELLSAAESSIIAINIAGQEHEVELTRAAFERMIEPSLEAAVATVERSLDGAGITIDDVDAVLLAGGSSRIPAVRRMLVDRIGRPVLADGDPKNAVARGAAILPRELVAGEPPGPTRLDPDDHIDAQHLELPPAPIPGSPAGASTATTSSPSVEPVTAAPLTPGAGPAAPLVDPGDSNRPRWPLLAVMAAVTLVVIALGVSLFRQDTPQLNNEAAATEATLTATIETSPETEGSDTTEPSEATEVVDSTTTAPASGPIEALAGTRVTILGPERSDIAAGAIQDALDVFATDNDMTIIYTPSEDFNTEISDLTASGDAPDIALYASIGLFETLVDNGSILPVPDDVVASTPWAEPFLRFGTVDGVHFGLPNKVEPKSVVWYQPALFEQRGYSVPTSFDEFIGLTETMIANGDTPLCVGIESGGATGWTYTDWVEDMMLRFAGPVAYRQWIDHDIAFDDPVVVEQMEAVIDLWNTPGTVFASGGTIASTSFTDNAQPLVDGDCLMHRQASFYTSFFPEGTPLGGDDPRAVSAFYFPSNSGRPVLGAGVLTAAHNDRPEIWAVVEYMSSAAYADARQAAQAERSGGISGFLSGADGIDVDLYEPIEQVFIDILTSADGFHPDASDLMPFAVGAGTFWTEGTAAVNGNSTAAQAAEAIENSWPE